MYARWLSFVSPEPHMRLRSNQTWRTSAHGTYPSQKGHKELPGTWMDVLFFFVHWIILYKIPMICHFEEPSNSVQQRIPSNLTIFLSVCPGARNAWQDQTASHHGRQKHLRFVGLFWGEDLQNLGFLGFERPLLRKDPQIADVFVEPFRWCLDESRREACILIILCYFFRMICSSGFCWAFGCLVPHGHGPWLTVQACISRHEWTVEFWWKKTGLNCFFADHLLKDRTNSSEKL